MNGIALRRIAVSIAIAAIVGASADTCGGSSGGGGNSSGGSGGNSNSDCGYSWKPCATAPVATADAVPQVPTARASGDGGGFDCQLDIDPEGSGLTVGAGIMLATAYTYCTLPPVPSTFHLQMAIQRQNPSSGNWYDWPPPPYSSREIPPMLPAKTRHTDHAPCEPGTYRYWAQVSGTTGGSKPAPFGPIQRTANVITVTQAECKGPLTRR